MTGRSAGTPAHGVFCAAIRQAFIRDHLWMPQEFDRTFEVAGKEGFENYVELGPGAALATAVRWTTRGAIHVERPATEARPMAGAMPC